MEKRTLWILIAVSIFLTASASFAGGKNCKPCSSWTPAMVGGPVANGKNLLTVRYMADANIELTYKNQVVLLSAYYDKGPDNPRFVDMDQVKRADAIFLGHAHFDHMTEAARISYQTGAPVYGHWSATDTVRAQWEKVGVTVDEDQAIEVFDGDVFQFDGFTVEAIHILHSGQGVIVQTPSEIYTMYRNLNKAIKDDLGTPKSPEQEAWEDNPWWNKGNMAPVVRQEGVFAYLFTFGKNFRFIFYDSANATLTDEIQAAMARIGGETDLATLAYAGGPEQYAVAYDMPEIELFNPRYFFPSHGYPSHIMDPSPLFQAIRDELPDTTPIFLMPKQVLCFNVKNHKLISDGILKGSEISRHW